MGNSAIPVILWWKRFTNCVALWPNCAGNLSGASETSLVILLKEQHTQAAHWKKKSADKSKSFCLCSQQDGHKPTLIQNLRSCGYDKQIYWLWHGAVLTWQGGFQEGTGLGSSSPRSRHYMLSFVCSCPWWHTGENQSYRFQPKAATALQLW